MIEIDAAGDEPQGARVAPMQLSSKTSALYRPAGGSIALARMRLAFAGKPNSMAVKKWSQDVTERSDALDLEENVFEKADPAAIARSLKTSAEQSHRRKAEPYRSAMSMLTFYINRAGKNLPQRRKRVLEVTKGELRKLFGRGQGRKRRTS